MKTVASLIGLSALGLSAPAMANATDADRKSQAPDLVVTAPLMRERLDTLQATSVLSADALGRAMKATLGDTLASLPGVSATSFGPGASRPVLRGFQGERIRILIDGIGSIDVSNTSADHAVSDDPTAATRIEVLRGPATLLYGAAAMGGVVNQIDDRIPLTVPADVIEGHASMGYGTAANDFSAATGITARLDDSVAVHVGASYRDTGDMEIGGHADSKYLRARLADVGEEHDEHGTLDNSALWVKSGSVGVSKLFDNGMIGIAVSRLETRYGIPGHSFDPRLTLADYVPDEDHDEDEDHDHEEDEDHDHGHSHEDIQIKLKQTRIDAKAQYRFSDGFIEDARFRFGWAKYEHSEIADGEVETTFRNNGYEGRLELTQRQRGAWRGAFGVQLARRDFKVRGAELVLPDNITNQFGAFALQALEFDPLTIEGALRYDRDKVSARDLGARRHFDSVSGSLAANYKLADAWRLGASVSRTARAPAAEELFFDGAHAATRSYEIGDPDLKVEKAWGAEAWLRARAERYSFGLTAYWSRFSNYILAEATGEIAEDLPVLRYGQVDARYYGLELEASVELGRAAGWTFVGDVTGDITRAKNLDDGTPLPRIPAKRLLVGLEGQSETLDARGEVELVDDQKKVGAYEFPTDGYTMVNLATTWRPWGRNREVSLVAQLNNLFDVDARRHASFLKDVAPLAGRDFRLTARIGF